MRETLAAPGPGLLRESAVRFIVALGIVSLFADMTYEGARSVTGPYLGMLGAGAAAVGLVAGFGEFLGYGLRLLSGHLTDRTGSYWAISIAGYGISLTAVPLLALTGRWELAVLLIAAERAGKAIRNPARDVMLSHAASHTGLGFGFGLHRILDQTGAVLGPLLVGAALYWEGSYQTGFAILAIPALCAMAVLFAAVRFLPDPHDLKSVTPDLSSGTLPPRFWIYVGATSLIAAGYADFPLIAYHFGRTQLIAPAAIPAFYALAMAADAMAAFVLGRLFDRIGIGAMILAACAAALASPLAFLGGSSAALAGTVLWGIGLGAQGSVMRAAVAPLAPAAKRGTAFGIFNAAYGLAWFAGSSLLGVLYGWSIAAAAATSALLQMGGIAILLRFSRFARGA